MFTITVCLFVSERF